MNKISYWATYATTLLTLLLQSSSLVLDLQRQWSGFYRLHTNIHTVASCFYFREAIKSWRNQIYSSPAAIVCIHCTFMFALIDSRPRYFKYTHWLCGCVGNSSDKRQQNGCVRQPAHIPSVQSCVWEAISNKCTWSVWVCWLTGNCSQWNPRKQVQIPVVGSGLINVSFMYVHR